MSKEPPSLSIRDQGKAKFYAWVNTADNNEFSFHETEESAEAWCEYFLGFELEDGSYTEEACFPNAIGYGRIVKATKYEITDEAKNYKYKSEEEIPEHFTDEQASEVEGDVWPHDADIESVGLLKMVLVAQPETKEQI